MPTLEKQDETLLEGGGRSGGAALAGLLGA